MKKKWKQLNRPHRLLIVSSGILNVIALFTSFFSSSRLSVWLAGVGNGIFITFIMISFGYLSPLIGSTDQEVSGNE